MEIPYSIAKPLFAYASAAGKLSEYVNLTIEFTSEETQECILEFFVSDTIAYQGEDASISIYMNNYQDTLAGFVIWLHLEHPDLIQFGGPNNFDTTGTLLSDWQNILSLSVGGMGYDYRIM